MPPNTGFTTSNVRVNDAISPPPAVINPGNVRYRQSPGCNGPPGNKTRSRPGAPVPDTCNAITPSSPSPNTRFGPAPRISWTVADVDVTGSNSIHAPTSKRSNAITRTVPSGGSVLVTKPFVARSSVLQTETLSMPQDSFSKFSRLAPSNPSTTADADAVNVTGTRRKIESSHPLKPSCPFTSAGMPHVCAPSNCEIVRSNAATPSTRTRNVSGPLPGWDPSHESST